MQKRCYNCMEPIDDNGVCSACGFDANDFQNSGALKSGDLLKDRYFIGKVFVCTPDSTVYIAYDEELEKKVFVRVFTGEFVAKADESPNRDELTQRFLSYSKRMASISLCNILPRTVDAFEQNSIGYLVTDYFEGENLKTLINSGIDISSSNALKIAKQLLEGIKVIHNSKMIYGAISPDTLYILKNGEVRLFGIGSPFYDFLEDTDCRIEVLNPSYVAPELYDANAKKGAFCDVYSVGAILYRMLTKTIPPVSFLRSGGENIVSPQKANKDIPKNIVNALLNALNWQIEARTQSVDVFLKELSAEKVKRKTSLLILWSYFLGFLQKIWDLFPDKKEKPKTDTNKAAKKPNKKLLWLWISLPIAVLIVIMIVLLIVFATNSGAKDKDISASGEDGEWYYGSGVETPRSSSEYNFGEGADSSSRKQSASSNTSNDSSSEVNITDPNMVECPDLVGYTITYARKTLQELGLTVGNITYEYSNDYQADYVISQSMKKGGMLPKGTSINLVVSKGKKEQTNINFPDVIGKDIFAATKEIKNAGFEKIEYVFSNGNEPSGTVTTVSPEKADITDYNTTIILTVSGEKMVVNSYIGSSVAQIKQDYPNINFKFVNQNNEPVEISEEEYQDYVVTSQDVEKGTVGFIGMTITVTINNNTIT